jgi:pectate lyase
LSVPVRVWETGVIGNILAASIGGDRPVKNRAIAASHALLATLAAAGLLVLGAEAQAQARGNAPLAVPGAVGWAATTQGGRGGRIIKVTTLASDGEGSLRAALAVAEPRIVVFEVGGVIDLNRQTLRITEPNVTIAGQTAPSPGITLIQGGIDVVTHDVVLQHIRVRPGEAGQPKAGGWGEDAFSTQAGARDVIVDHCTFTWATDENLSASGPRFTGTTPDDWRRGTSHRITFSHNIIAEGLANSTHPKFEHSKGSLIHDNVSDILIYANLYAHDVERSPLFKGGVRGTIVNNFIYNPGTRAVHYNLQPLEWGTVAFANGRMTAVGNVLRAGPSTHPDMAFLMLGGAGDLDYHGRDNLAVDRLGRPLPMFGRYTTSAARIIEHAEPLDWPTGLEALPATQVETFVLANVGARPWDRDPHDTRLLADVTEGRGTIIDSETDVGGYPVVTPTRRPFDPALWDLATLAPRSPAALDNSAKAPGT